MAGESVEVAMEAREQQSQTDLEPVYQNVVDVVDQESQQHPPDPHHHHHHRRHRRHHRHHRHHRRSRSSRSARYEKSILHFGTAHIVIGIICVVLQMVQFTNNSIFSQAQPGLWCGSFFVITGSVCLGLASTKGVYSTLAMLAFSLVSLFMALTLASLSWFGAEGATQCQIYWNEYCGIPSNQTSTLRPLSTTTLPPSYNLTTLETESVTLLENMPKRSFRWVSSIDMMSSSNSSSNENDCWTTTVPVPESECCWDLYHGYCGYDIGLGRTMHSLLVLCGVAGCTTSFILSTLACSRPGGRDNGGSSGRRPRLSSIFSIGGSDHTPTGGRPITPWEFPPPSKDPLPVDDRRVVGSGFPEEPPPPYVEQDNPDCTSYL